MTIHLDEEHARLINRIDELDRLINRMSDAALSDDLAESAHAVDLCLEYEDERDGLWRQLNQVEEQMASRRARDERGWAPAVL